MPKKQNKESKVTKTECKTCLKNALGDGYFLVNEIIRERVLKNGDEQVFVSWVGYPKKYNSWVYKRTVMPLDIFVDGQSTEVSSGVYSEENSGKEERTFSGNENQKQNDKKCRKAKPVEIVKKEEEDCSDYCEIYSSETAENKEEENDTILLNNISFEMEGVVRAMNNSADSANDTMLLVNSFL